MERGRRERLQDKSKFGPACGRRPIFGADFSSTPHPAPRPRGAGQRSLPATIHELELVFGSDGKLRRYQYAPRAGRVEVPTGG
jgi:hypothetical protein